MVINGTFVVFLIIAVVSGVLAVTLKNWVAKLILFIAALGASSIAAGVVALDVRWVLLINVVLFLATGITSVRIKKLGNRIVGIVLIIVGLFLIIPLVEALGSTAPGTVWSAITQSLQTGWATFVDTIQSVLNIP